MNDEFGTWRQAPGSLVCRRQADRAGRRGAGHGMQGWLASPRQRGVLGAAVAGFMLLGVEQARGASESDDTEQVCAETSPTAGKPMDAGSCRTNLIVRKYALELEGGHPIPDSGPSLKGGHPILDSGPSLTGGHPILDSGSGLKGSHPILDSGPSLKGGHPILDSGSSLKGNHPILDSGPSLKGNHPILDSGRSARVVPPEETTLSSGLETLSANMSWLRSSLSTALVPVSRDIGSLSSSLSTASGVIASLSTSSSTRIGKLESGLDEMSSTAQFQTQQIDGVSKRIDRAEAQFDELNRQMAPLARASDEARRNDSFIAPTVSGGGSGPMVESSGPGADHTGRSRIDPAGCTLANGFDATATGLCAAAGTIAGRDGARESRRADGATAYGAYARAREHHATAVGFRALAARDGAVAIGYQAGALGGQAAALGDGARADGDRSVALGASALATGRGAVALGAGSIADRDATVSIGSPGRERRLVNLAPGVAPGDAVNLSQLATLGRSLEDVARRAYTGVAMSMAMSGLYLPSLNPGEVAVGVGVGGFSGYRAIALNLKGLAGNGRLGWGAGVSTTGRLTGFNLGAGWKW